MTNEQFNKSPCPHQGRPPTEEMPPGIKCFGLAAAVTEEDGVKGGVIAICFCKEEGKEGDCVRFHLHMNQVGMLIERLLFIEGMLELAMTGDPLNLGQTIH